MDTEASPPNPPVPDSAQPPVLEIVVPVFNEAHVLQRSVSTLVDHVRQLVPYPTRITIVDNASSDDTLEVARRLAANTAEVRALHLDIKGRGNALATAWDRSDAAVLAYMDVDLSTELSALGPLIEPLVHNQADVAIGSRLSHRARVTRCVRREVISRTYNLTLRAALGVHFSDAQCGFKALRADAAAELLPEVKDTGWFFDTELLVAAEHGGLRIHEVPVTWVEDPDSRVALIATALADLDGIHRLRANRRRAARHQLEHPPLPAHHGALS
jgi:glycosyltransferase involved in cell wall biosynthesis